jgi:succinate dehydrogenase hydrophobic anchor subunit
LQFVGLIIAATCGISYGVYTALIHASHGLLAVLYEYKRNQAMMGLLAGGGIVGFALIGLIIIGFSWVVFKLSQK